MKAKRVIYARSIRAALPLLALTAATLPPPPQPSASELRATITTLVGFGTRHTLSTVSDPHRGIGAARVWARSRFEALSKGCGGCLAVETVGDSFTGPRAPNGVRVEDVFAVQRGTTDPDRVVIVQGHLDSRRTDIMDSEHDAPGANDDGSGSALVLESARLLSKRRFPATIVYALLSGEEQGLWGGELLARTAKARGWKVAAVLNDDIVGNTHGQGGQHIDTRVRVFSEGDRAADTPAEAKARRMAGAEDDAPSRALARYMRDVAKKEGVGLEVLAIRRPDRFQRGGDHLPFLDAGYPAVRVTEATEDYDRQHQDVRAENGRAFGDVIAGVDFPYLARVTALNMATLAALARAPAAPEGVTIAGAVSPDTTVRWGPVSGASRYCVHLRRADLSDWTEQRCTKDASATSMALPGVNIDDNFFGVAAAAADGTESLITFAGAARK